MKEQEFLNNARELIKGSEHEGYLYTEIQSLLGIIDKYNESMHILDLKFVPVYNDPRFIDIIDTHKLSHGNFFIDKDKLMFLFKMDDYELRLEVSKLCDYYKKSIDFSRYIELDNSDFSDEMIWKNAPKEYKHVNAAGDRFVKIKNVDINQITKNSENSIFANINALNNETCKFEKQQFEFNSVGLGKVAMSIVTDVDNTLNSYLAENIKTPNNNVSCVENKAYGYDIIFGLENYIEKLKNHKFDELNCEEISYQRCKYVEGKKNNSIYSQPSMFDIEDSLE